MQRTEGVPGRPRTKSWGTLTLHSWFRGDGESQRDRGRKVCPGRCEERPDQCVIVSREKIM